MKQTIEFYYNIMLEDIEEANGNYHFKLDNQDYFFVFFSRREEELNDIINVCIEMKNKGIDVHTIIKNKANSYITKVNSYNYILFTVNNLREEYDIFDIVNLNSKLILNSKTSSLYRNNWQELWSKKIDYFEYQIKELAIDKSIIKNSVSYYIGLSELAISYVAETNKKYNTLMEGKIVLSHRRVGYPNYKLNFLNPLSFIFDLEVRDVAEYLKAMLFICEIEEVLEELNTYLKIKKLNIYEAQMLLARLIYPSYYFDTYEKVMDKDEDSEKLVAIIKKVDEIEYFLKKTYELLSSYVNIDKIEWFIN